jgi:hypothetical protein
MPCASHLQTLKRSCAVPVLSRAQFSILKKNKRRPLEAAPSHTAFVDRRRSRPQCARAKGAERGPVDPVAQATAVHVGRSTPISKSKPKLLIIIKHNQGSPPHNLTSPLSNIYD